jgi:hypothetical protein
VVLVERQTHLDHGTRRRLNSPIRHQVDGVMRARSDNRSPEDA